jgi:hypothetical protein
MFCWSPATQEAEIRRRDAVSKILNTKKGWSSGSSGKEPQREAEFKP